MPLTLWDRITVLHELYLICSATFITNLRAIFVEPSLILHPKKLKAVFFSNVWAFMAPSVDEGGREVKESLIRPNAFGWVLDLGAGESLPPCESNGDACTRRVYTRILVGLMHPPRTRSYTQVPR